MWPPQKQQQHLRLTTATLAVVQLLLATAAVGVNADVTLQFYLLQVERWDSNAMDSQFKSAIATGAVTYCSTRLAECGLNSSTDYNFTSGDVKFTPGYPKNSNSRYMDLSIYVTCTPRSTGRSANLTTATLAAILEIQRPEIYNRLGYYIVKIGDTSYSIPPPTLVNCIVVPIAIIVTFVLVVVALALSRKHHAKSIPVNTTSCETNGVSVQAMGAAPTAASRQASASKVQQKVKVPPSAAASPTSTALLPGAMNEGFNQSSSEKELRQRHTAANGEEMVLTDAVEFNG